MFWIRSGPYLIFVYVFTAKFSERPSQCLTTWEEGVQERGVLCVFPFEWQGKIYTGCTTDSDPDQRRWCSTKVNSTGSHTTGKWGYCSANCKSLY